MKEFFSFLSGALSLLVSLAIPPNAGAQMQTAMYISTGPNSNGFYEYLPQGYSSGNTRYPLLVFIHGVGELGNGGSDLPAVLRNGPPKLISQGQFPATFTVKGNTYSFIVISPQFIAWPSNGDIDRVIRYAITHYRVDAGRIYLTGLSMGGGVTWAYASSPGNANILAGIIPIAGGQLWSGDAGAKAMAKANLPIFAAANKNDPTVPASTTIDNINLINSIVPAINPKALDTIYDASGHEGWTVTYDPSTDLHNGLNAYQWMLQYTRSSAPAVTDPLPVQLSAYAATLLPDQSQVAVNWTTTLEQNNLYFIVQRSADGQSFSDVDTVAAAPDGENGHSYVLVDEHPLAGTNLYRLEQVDLDGHATYYDVLRVVVSIAERGFHISPNPADGDIHLQLANGTTGPLEVRLLDHQGRTLQTWAFQKLSGGWSQLLNVSSLAAGTYFIQVTGNNFRSTAPIFKR